MLMGAILAGDSGQAPDAAATQPRVVPEHLRHPDGYVHPPGAAVSDIYAVPCIPEESWELCTWMINPSDPQRKLMEALYDQYRKDDWQFRKEKVQHLWNVSAALVAERGWKVQAAPVEEFIRLVRAAEDLESVTTSMEEALFTQVESVVAEEQRPRWARARVMRDRERNCALASRYPKSHIDLERMYWETIAAAGVIAPNADADLEALLQEYSAAAGPLNRELDRRFRAEIAPSMRRNVEIATLNVASLGLKEKEALREHGRDLRRPALAVARSLLEVNERFLDRFCDALSAEGAIVLRDRFQRMAYPVVFPNPFDLAGLMAALESCPDARSEIPTSEWVEGHRVGMQAVTERMRTRYKTWREYVVLSSGYLFTDYGTYADEMMSMQSERRRLAAQARDEAIERVKNAPCEAVAEAAQKLTASIERWESELARMAEAKRRWPDPYD